MPFPTGTTLTPWSDNEFQRLQEIVLETVSSGGTVVEACEKFSEETNFLRSPQSARFKFQTVIKPKCEFEYVQAQEKGKEVLAQRAMPGKKLGRRTTISRVLKVNNDNNSDENVHMTQSELIRFLRSIEIIDPEFERVKKELDKVRADFEQMVRERDELQHKNLLLQKKYDDMAEEYKVLNQAMNIVRRNVTQTTEPTSARIVVDNTGTVQRFETGQKS